MLDDRIITESAKDNDAPVWNSYSDKTAWELYLGEKAGAEDISPYAPAARMADFAGPSPAYSFVGNIEPFYDETVAYFEKLKAAGVQAEVDVFEGCFHAFDSLGNTKPKNEAHRRLRKAFLTGLK